MRNLFIFLALAACTFFVLSEGQGTTFRHDNKVVSITRNGISVQPVENYVATEIANGVVNGAKEIISNVSTQPVQQNAEIPPYNNITKRDKVNILNNLKADIVDNKVLIINENPIQIDFVELRLDGYQGAVKYVTANNLRPNSTFYIPIDYDYTMSLPTYTKVICEAYGINFKAVRPIR